MCWQIVPVHLLGDMVCPWSVEVARREFSGLRSQILRRRSSCGQMTPVMWNGPWDVLPSFSVVSSWLAVAKSCEISWIWTRIEIIFILWLVKFWTESIQTYLSCYWNGGPYYFMNLPKKKKKVDLRNIKRCSVIFWFCHPLLILIIKVLGRL